MNSDLKRLRKMILKTSMENKTGHIAPAFSILEIIYALYKEVLTPSDCFILSKGHGCLALYAVFHEMGFIKDEDFYGFTQYDSILGGHPDRNKLKEIKASTGSLGHGFPMALGVALSKKIKNEPGTVYCLVGDGECNEGSVWETAMLASHLKLNNLVCLVDNNRSQIRAVPSRKLEARFEAFNWNWMEVYGHSVDHIAKSCAKIKGTTLEFPTVIICDTLKGYGIHAMRTNMFEWHHKAPTLAEYEQFCEELNQTCERCGYNCNYLRGNKFCCENNIICCHGGGVFERKCEINLPRQ